jgi:hypothetical protein
MRVDEEGGREEEKKKTEEKVKAVMILSCTCAEWKHISPAL